MTATKSPLINVLFSIGLAAIAAIGLNSTANAAEPEVSERERIMAEIDKRLANDEARQAAMQAGKERSVLCANCHGVDGNSLRPEIPNLAEQNTTYIIEQIGKFVDGRRQHFVMPVLAKDFTFQDKVNLAVYYTSQKLEPVKASAKIAARGKGIYKSLCIRCHGADGRGTEGYALIARQKVGYAKLTLERFRANANKTDDFDPKKRSDVSMEAATGMLTDREIEGLANFAALME